MYVKHISSLQFLTYAAFFAIVVAAIVRFVPGRAPPLRHEPYSPEELGAHDRKLGKYFVAGGGFLVLGALHMAVKNVPWIAQWLAGAGYAGHLVRDLSNTHLMIVGGGTLMATGLAWYILPRIVGRPLASEGLAQAAFWLTVIGLAAFYVAMVGNGIAMGHLVSHGWDYQAAKVHMGKWYKVPVGVGAGIMGMGYWAFAAGVLTTIFQSRLVKVPKPSWHLWKFVATGVAALTVGTVQGVIQVEPANASWLYRAGHAGEWIDPISHAHINLVTGLTMLVAGALFALAPRFGGTSLPRRTVDRAFYGLLLASLSFYGVCLYLGFHEGKLVVGRGLTVEQAEAATPLHPYLLMGSGIAMMAAFWALLVLLLRAYRGAPAMIRRFVLAGVGALAIGTLQGPVQAFPAVNDLLDKGGYAGDVIVNLHAQLNMLGGLMVLLVGASLGLLAMLGGRIPRRAATTSVAGVSTGVALYYAAGIGFSATEAHSIAGGRSFRAAVASLEPWPAIVLVPAALVVLVGFAAYARAAWVATAWQRDAARSAFAAMPGRFTGHIPKRVRRRSPASVAAYELPLGILGFPGVGWLFAGFPITGSLLLTTGPAFTWAVLPVAFSPYSPGPLHGVGWKLEFVWLPLSTLISAALLYRAHARRRRRLEQRGPGAKPPTGRRAPRRRGGYRTRVGVAAGSIFLLLVALPFVPAVAGLTRSAVQYAYQPRFTKDITGEFVRTPKGTVKLFTWSDPQESFPADALRVRRGAVQRLLVRAAALDRVSAYQLYDLTRGNRVGLTARRVSARVLSLTPIQRLRRGRYVLVSSHEGMFGGRDFSYVAVVGAKARVTVIAEHRRERAPAVIGSLLPVAAALVALVFTLLLLRSFASRPGVQKALWGMGFACFAVATGCEAAAQRTAWHPGLFRAYYLAGGCLTVALLGAGSAWLLFPRLRRVILVALALGAVGAVVSVAVAPVDAHTLAATASGRPPPNGAIGGYAYLWAIALNSLGSLALIGGSLWSIARRQRVTQNLWIAGGALAVAAATGMSRAGGYSLVYVGELVGIAAMFAGFTIAGRGATPYRRPRAVPVEKAALAR